MQKILMRNDDDKKQTNKKKIKCSNYNFKKLIRYKKFIDTKFKL